MRLSILNFLLFNVRSYTQALDTICMVKVVFQVELVEVERYNELHEVGRQVGFSKETNRKVRPVKLG